MISEGSCDTEDWSNGFLKFSFTITGINCILKYIKIEIYIVTIIYIVNYISQYYCIFDSLNIALVSMSILKKASNVVQHNKRW